MQAGAGAGVALAVLRADPAAASGRPGAAGIGPRLELSFDENWRFYRGDVSGAQVPGFDDDDDGWRELDLPHDWSIEDLPYATSDEGAATDDPSAFAYISDPASVTGAPAIIGPYDTHNSAGQAATGYTVGGIGWYRKRFTLQRAAGYRTELRFDGVYQDADFWLNGRHLGFHPNGYVSFAFDITPYLNDGENVLAVRVDTSGKNSRWYAGSGIYRHTWLTVTGPVRIPRWGVQVTTPVVDARQSTVMVVVPVESEDAITAAVRVTISNAAGRAWTKTAEPRPIGSGSTATYTVEVPVANARLWSPEEPSLYQAQADVLVDGQIVDGTTTTFGIREIRVSDKGLLLNGVPVKLRGGCCHHDNGPLGSVSLRASEERRVQILKSLGFNAIRTSHNPPSPALLDACDRLGMLVYDEFSDMWQREKNPQDYHLYFPDWWRRDLTNMILRDRNRASVIMWSLGNEIFYADYLAGDTTGAGSEQYAADLAALVRELDGTRPVTEGGDAFLAGRPGVLDLGDVHYANMPVPAGIPSEFVQNFTAAHADYPGKAVVQSESFPSAVYDVWKIVEDNDYVVGDFVWTAWDYIGEAGIGAPPLYPAGTITYPWYLSDCGDVSLIGQRKPQSYWRSVVWGLSPLEMAVERPAPPGDEQTGDGEEYNWGYYDELRSWTWDVDAGQPMSVHVYTAGDTVTVLLNGTEAASATLTEDDKRVATVSVPYRPGILTAIAYQGGKEIARQTLETVGEPASLRLTADIASLTTDRDQLAHVLAEVLDDQGRVVPDAVVPVSFQVGGAGNLEAVGNANPHNVDSFRQPRRYTYHGQALAILRPAKRPGRLTLTASAPGLRPAAITLAVLP